MCNNVSKENFEKYQLSLFLLNHIKYYDKFKFCYLENLKKNERNAKISQKSSPANNCIRVRKTESYSYLRTSSALILEARLAG